MLIEPTSTKLSFSKLRSSYQGTKNVGIYAFSSGKILDVRKVAGVKDMTNIMSAADVHGWPRFHASVQQSCPRMGQITFEGDCIW